MITGSDAWPSTQTVSLCWRVLHLDETVREPAASITKVFSVLLHMSLLPCWHVSIFTLYIFIYLGGYRVQQSDGFTTVYSCLALQKEMVTEIIESDFFYFY